MSSTTSNKKYYRKAKKDLAVLNNLIKGQKKQRKNIRRVDLKRSPFPPNHYCKLDYFDTYILTQTSGIGQTQQWRLNSLWDCDYTHVTGDHQPYYYDQISPMYAKYRVYSVKMDYWYTCDNGSAVPVDSQLVFRPTPDGTTPTSSPLGLIVESERPNSIIRVFAAGGPPVTGTLFFSCRKILGMSKRQYDSDDTLGAATGTNPISSPYLNCLSLSTTPNSVGILRVKFTFYCKFDTRKIQGQS